ncbi:unnamed protein product [Prunus armeniaca]|uniref:Uncharacterized protein n=1 Tax=Prunus armeniaca TaxID=36596 RepID=A0A6J5UL39_PRUAR|nr:unnamed protein product [Prunus armeniaca]
MHQGTYLYGFSSFQCELSGVMRIRILGSGVVADVHAMHISGRKGAGNASLPSLFSASLNFSASQSCVMFEFSVGDISTERAVLGGQRHRQNSSANNSRISYVEEETAIKGFNFRDDKPMNKKWIYRSNLSDATLFFRVKALCHTNIPVEEDDQIHKLKYKAESPEESLISPLQRRLRGKKYKLLNLLEFCRARERMSVILSNEDGQIFLLFEGADNIIFDRLAENGRTYLLKYET